MTIRIDRRSLLLTGALGLGALAIPGFARAFVLGDLKGFTHGVASGEPSQHSMLLWTRYAGTADAPVKVRAEVALDPGFAKIVAGGETITGAWRDFTAKVTVTGLEPGTRYFYRFVAPDGTMSPAGRTQTLPGGDARKFRMAIFSCSNMGFGYFNAYAHAAAAAARGDLDLAIHLGDYFYEYAPNNYPTDDKLVPGRLPEPLRECLALADYRLRFASYRLDPDLQALHAAVPMIVQSDDHETANNSWEGGAENHGKDEGDWSARKAAAMQAWHEWMPVSETPWARYDIGSLASLYRTESRLYRDRTLDPATLLFAPDPAKAIAQFRDGTWRDPAATMLGGEQEAWIAREMAASARSGQRWQIAAFGTIMGNLSAPANATEWLGPDAAGYVKARVMAAAALGKAGLPFEMDSWGGFPAARERFLKAAQAADADLLVICGDSHNAWAFDLAQDGKPAGVEFAGHAVSSPGFEDYLATDPKALASSLVAGNPELKWCDTSRRGYMALTLTPETATNEWLFVDTVTSRNPAASVGHTATVKRGRRVMA